MTSCDGSGFTECTGAGRGGRSCCLSHFVTSAIKKKSGQVPLCWHHYGRDPRFRTGRQQPLVVSARRNPGAPASFDRLNLHEQPHLTLSRAQCTDSIFTSQTTGQCTFSVHRPHPIVSRRPETTEVKADESVNNMNWRSICQGARLRPGDCPDADSKPAVFPHASSESGR